MILPVIHTLDSLRETKPCLEKLVELISIPRYEIHNCIDVVARNSSFDAGGVLLQSNCTTQRNQNYDEKQEFHTSEKSHKWSCKDNTGITNYQKTLWEQILQKTLELFITEENPT